MILKSERCSKSPNLQRPDNKMRALMIEMSATLTVAIASGMKLAMSIGQRGVTEGMDVHRGRQNNGKNTAKMRKRVAVRVTNTEKKVASTRRVSIVVGNHLRERTLQMTLKHDAFLFAQKIGNRTLEPAGMSIRETQAWCYGQNNSSLGSWTIWKSAE